MGTIPTHTIEQVAAANDIVEVIGSYFPLKRAGANFRALCPFHQEKTPSFHVNPARQSFHCFGCGVGGSVFRFVMDYEHVDFPAAVRRLAARAGIPVIEESGGSASDDRQHEARRTLLKLHAEAAEWFHDNLLKRGIGKVAREYLQGRGISSAVAKSWQLGFAPESWDACLKWAFDRGYKRGTILQSGLVKLRDEERPESEVYDRFRGRLMFPICNDVGEVIAFSGRMLQPDAEKAKYLNSPETPLFRKGSILFGLHKTKRGLIDAGRAIVCEGQLDLITLFEAGLTNVVAPQGTAFTEGQARILKRYVNEAVLCFDADAAGEKAAERSLEPLLQHDLIVRIAEMPAGEDPDSLVRKDGAEKFRERVDRAPNFFDYWIERKASFADLTNLSAKMQLAHEFGETIGRIGSNLLRIEIINRVSSRLAISAEELGKIMHVKRYPAPQNRFSQTVAPPIHHTVAFLCLLAIRDPAARDFFLSRPWELVLAKTPGTELLARILAADLDPDDSASITKFMTTLSIGEEALVSGWLRKLFTDRGGVLQPYPINGLEVAQDWWRDLEMAELRRELQAAESRMKLPGLSAGEVVALQKQVVDLRGQLDEFPRPLPSHPLDA